MGAGKRMIKYHLHMEPLEDTIEDLQGPSLGIVWASVKDLQAFLQA